MTLKLPQPISGHITVLGDVMLDRYWTGATSRISPEAPVPVVKVEDIENRLGGAANVAVNLKALGCQTTLCGIIGEDEAGRAIHNLLTEKDIAADLALNTKAPTITKLRVLSRHQQLLRLDFEESSETTPTIDIKHLEKHLHGSAAVVISDYAKGAIGNCRALIESCKAAKIPVLVDPKGADFSRYHGATLITPNLHELETAQGACPSLEVAYKKAADLCRDLVLDAVLLTLSEQGMALIRPTEEPVLIPTQAREVFDVTGAGDTVIAALAAAVAAGLELEDATKLANAAAGIVVGKLGTSSVSASELNASIDAQRHSILTGVTTMEQLQNQLLISRTQNETVVFTNGCFDLLHAGHADYLERAAQLGDRLIVAVNDDTSVTRLKGHERPIVPLEQRMQMLAALRSVDWVIPFSEDTPAKVIDSIIPDVLTKGGDYQAEDIVGYDTVIKAGGRVEIMPFKDGCSTTEIINKIKGHTQN